LGLLRDVRWARESAGIAFVKDSATAQKALQLLCGTRKSADNVTQTIFVDRRSLWEKEFKEDARQAVQKLVQADQDFLGKTTGELYNGAKDFALWQLAVVKLGADPDEFLDDEKKKEAASLSHPLVALEMLADLAQLLKLPTHEIVIIKGQMHLNKLRIESAKLSAIALPSTSPGCDFSSISINSSQFKQLNAVKDAREALERFIEVHAEHLDNTTTMSIKLPERSDETIDFTAKQIKTVKEKAVASIEKMFFDAAKAWHGLTEWSHNLLTDTVPDMDEIFADPSEANVERKVFNNEHRDSWSSYYSKISKNLKFFKDADAKLKLSALVDGFGGGLESLQQALDKTKVASLITLGQFSACSADRFDFCSGDGFAFLIATLPHPFSRFPAFLLSSFLPPPPS